MQKQNFYITQSGSVVRKNNTVWFENTAVKKAIPVNSIDTIYCLGEVSINSKLLTFLAKQGIIMHFLIITAIIQGLFTQKRLLFLALF